MKEFIEIPFGAKDSELGGWEYTIPEGYIASIENGKIIVKKEESGDEKIRKELIEYIKDQQSSFISAPDCRDKYEEEENNRYNSWIAWLEKQGAKISVYRDTLFKIATILSQYEDKEDSPLEKIRSIMIDGTICSMDLESKKNERDEQKPIDEEMKILLQTEYEKGKADAIEQKSAWSEDDEKAVNDIMWIIEAYRKNRFNETHIQKANDSENWLKSLKERYTWKPSDEQMVVLELASKYERVFTSKQIDVLISLKEQLKKLREK